MISWVWFWCKQVVCVDQRIQRTTKNDLNSIRLLLLLSKHFGNILLRFCLGCRWKAKNALLPVRITLTVLDSVISPPVAISFFDDILCVHFTRTYLNSILSISLSLFSIPHHLPYQFIRSLFENCYLILKIKSFSESIFQSDWCSVLHAAALPIIPFVIFILPFYRRF